MSAKINRYAAKTEPPHNSDCAIAKAYSQAGDEYVAYADGPSGQLFAFDGQYAYGDRCIWELLEAKLCALRASGAKSVRILDLGCGPGTWLCRLVTGAHALGFRNVVARGFDIASGQVRRARELAVELSSVDGLSLTFEVADICRPLSEDGASIDLCLCLCGVLNHLPAAKRSALLAEIARVTARTFVTTVRAIGSTPSVYIDAIERAREFRQDNETDRLNVEFQSGRVASLHSHLFSAAELLHTL